MLLKRSALILLASTLMCVLLIAYLGVTRTEPAPPLQVHAPFARVFVSPLTNQPTAVANGRFTKLQDDVLIRVDGPARNVRVVRSPVSEPRGEEDFPSIMPPVALDELTARPFSVRMTGLHEAMPREGGEIEMDFVFKNAGRVRLNFPILTADEVRALPRPQTDPVSPGAYTPQQNDIRGAGSILHWSW